MGRRQALEQGRRSQSPYLYGRPSCEASTQQRLLFCSLACPKHSNLPGMPKARHAPVPLTRPSWWATGAPPQSQSWAGCYWPQSPGRSWPPSLHEGEGGGGVRQQHCWFSHGARGRLQTRASIEQACSAYSTNVGPWLSLAAQAGVAGTPQQATMKQSAAASCPPEVQAPGFTSLKASRSPQKPGSAEKRRDAGGLNGAGQLYSWARNPTLTSYCLPPVLSS